MSASAEPRPFKPTTTPHGLLVYLLNDSIKIFYGAKNELFITLNLSEGVKERT